MTTVFVFIRPLTWEHQRLGQWQDRNAALSELVYELECADLEAAVVDLRRLPPSAREVAKGRQVVMVTLPERSPAEAEWGARWQVASAAERSKITLGDLDVLVEPRRAAS